MMNRFLIVILIISFILSVYFATMLVNRGIDNHNSNVIMQQVQEQTKAAETEVDDVKRNGEPIFTEPEQEIYPFLQIDFAELKKRNPDTVGWLKIDSIGLDMPIVQYTDNELYLTRNFDKRKSSEGWPFVDCRSNIEPLGFNTVVYGHNLISGMFGNLKQFLEGRSDMGIIKFTTPNSQMIFEVCSVYVTDYEDWHYVKQDFFNDTEKDEFIKQMRDKNLVKAFDKDDLNPNDKLLTLSTCYGPAGTTRRLVVVARLIAFK